MYYLTKTTYFLKKIEQNFFYLFDLDIKILSFFLSLLQDNLVLFIY